MIAASDLWWSVPRVGSSQTRHPTLLRKIHARGIVSCGSWIGGCVEGRFEFTQRCFWRCFHPIHPLCPLSCAVAKSALGNFSNALTEPPHAALAGVALTRVWCR